MAEFVRVAGHDLNAPLRHIDGFAGIARQQLAGGDTAAVGDSLVRIEQAGTLLRRLVLGMKASLQLEARPLQIQPLDLSGCVARLLRTKSEVLRRAGARVSPSGNLPVIDADPYLLEELLGRLLDNAAQHSGSRAPRIDISAGKGEGEWHVCVADDGVGVAPELRSSVFEPFRRMLPPGAEATAGLGLHVCRRIAERHGGTIRCDEAAAGGGAAFGFTLPALRNPPRLRTRRLA